MGILRCAASIAIVVALLVVSVRIKIRAEGHLSPAIRARPSLLDRDVALHTASLRLFSLGFQQALAGILWVELLQRAKHELLTGSRLSWEYGRLDAITTLDRGFSRAFPFGGAYLSVFRQDRLGARLFLGKWVRQEPRNWRAHYALGYHLFAELDDREEAPAYLARAATLPGGPPWLSALGVRLLTEGGRETEALRHAVELFGQLHDRVARERLTQRVRSLRFRLQRGEWGSALAAFRVRTGREPSSLADLKYDLASSPPRELAMNLPLSETASELHPLMAERFVFRYDPKNRTVVAARAEDEKFLGQGGVYRPAP